MKKEIKMRKIEDGNIAAESHSCEYSQEWFDGNDDPIIGYVENSLDALDLEGVSWDDAPIEDWGTFRAETFHVLCVGGVATEIYYVDDVSETIRYQVFEDNGGGLSLFVLDSDGAPVWGHSGYEYAPENLLEDIKNLQELEDISELGNWEGNGAYYGAGDFQEWEETPDGSIQTAYDKLAENEWVDLVADENGVYPEKMGNAAREAFNIEE